MRFLNDADAFGVGEYAAGAARGHDRAVCITLGTGVGSAFLDRGQPVHAGPTVPPDGHIYRVVHAGRPLEETVSRRAIRTAYAGAAGRSGSRGSRRAGDRRPGPAGRLPGEPRAGHAFAGLGVALAPVVQRFGASIVVVGGAMAGSWDIIEPEVRRGLEQAGTGLGSLAVRPAERNQDAALLGAAYWSVSRRG